MGDREYVLFVDRPSPGKVGGLIPAPVLRCLFLFFLSYAFNCKFRVRILGNQTIFLRIGFF